MKRKIPRQALIEDIRQLTNIIESAHPDPYSKGGGRIAYHRRLQMLMRELPAKGMSPKEFGFALMRFLASLKDGHTAIHEESMHLDNEHPGGIPLIFGAIEGKLYVRAVVHAADKDLIGSLLVSAAGIETEELLKRVETYFGCENAYQALGKLGNRPALLFHRETLELLIPEWQAENPGDEISVHLWHPDGRVKEHSFNTAESNAPAQITCKHPNHLPAFSNPENPYFFFRFVDKSGCAPGKIAVLRIANMTTFREMYEYFRASGMHQFENWGRLIFGRLHPDSDMPENYEDVIAGLPSATAVFLELFETMKSAQTRHLIVDLRDNKGGNDVMNRIFTYFLVGFEQTVRLMKNNGTVRKMSEFLAGSSEQGIDLAQIPYHAQVPLILTDYDFSMEPEFCGKEYEDSIRASLERDFSRMASFQPEFTSRKHEALHFPENLFILSSELTFSTGYNLMAELTQLGGKIVGIPSGQAGNSCGDVRHFQLENSKVKGTVSTKIFTAFPDDPERGTLLVPNHPLSYEKLKVYDFDENASLRYGLALAQES